MHREYFPLHRHLGSSCYHPWGRKFLTEEEKKELRRQHKKMKIQWIEQYKESLQKELKGINETLDELNKGLKE